MTWVDIQESLLDLWRNRGTLIMFLSQLLLVLSPFLSNFSWPRDWEYIPVTGLSKNSVIVYLFMSVMSAVRVLIPAHFISRWDSFDGCPPRQFLCSQLYSEFLGTRENKIITHHNNEETPHAHKSNSFVSRDTFHGLTWDGDTILSWQCICLLFLGDFLLSGLKGPS